MRFISLAWRNIRRNRRRTLLTLVAFSLGVTALSIVWSVFDGGNAQMITNMTNNYTGYVQIHRHGYADNPNVDLNFSSQDEAALQLQSTTGVIAVSSRMETMALISSDDNSRGILVIGVDPQAEPTVTVLNQKLVEGHYFSVGEKGGIILGKSLARILGAKLGGEIAVVTQATQGQVGAMRYKVQGLYETGNDGVDALQAYITRADAADLLDSAGQMTSVVVKLNDRSLTDQVVAQLRQRAVNHLDVEGWDTLLPEVAQTVAFHEAFGKVVSIILFSIVIVGVMNTIMMSVMERWREFGVMMAMGTSPMQIFRLIIYEGFFLGLLGLAIGLAIGYGIVSYLGAVGINASEQKEAFQSMKGLTSILHPQLSMARMVFLGTLVLLITAIATLFPAWRAARLVPLHAIQGKISDSKVKKSKGKHLFGFDWMSGRFLLLSLAMRNLGRHSRRSRLNVLAMTVGLAAFIFLSCIATGYVLQAVENATSIVTGDVQIERDEFKADMRPGLWLPGGTELMDKLPKMPFISAATPRVQTTAMISMATKSEPIVLSGISPESEKNVTILYRAIKEGHYLQPGHDKEIVMGKKLAELLHVRLGDRVIIMAQALDGNLASEGFVVAGLFGTGGGVFDKSTCYITLAASQKLLGLEGKITNIALKVQGAEHISSITQAISAILPPGDIRVLPWQQLFPELVQMRTILKRVLATVLTIVLVMVSVIVMNTVLMSVTERTREFGTMLAVGTRPTIIVRVVLWEAAILGIGGSFAGIVVGSLITLMHMKHGLSLAAHGAASAIPGLTDIVFPKFSVGAIALPGVLLPCLVLIAALYPALRAARLEPIKALRNG